MKKLIYILLVSLVLTACSNISEVEISNVNDLSFVGFENNLVNLTLNVKVNNPNNFNIKVKAMELKIYANNIYLGRLQSNNQTIINRKSEENYTMELQLRLANVFSGFSTFLAIKNAGQANIRIEGSITGRSLLWKKTVPIDEQRSINF